MHHVPFETLGGQTQVAGSQTFDRRPTSKALTSWGRPRQPKSSEKLSVVDWVKVARRHNLGVYIERCGFGR